ncbi:hypothetical protein [Kordiimonas aestuarii]|uniref:hypothetical protein n=1 Tax=Kordiimonas aestuarii TaxID=1005925 RepID=UPI0021CE2814|nr:hypothetical protein [Kordiimonas aestuarii]
MQDPPENALSFAQKNRLRRDAAQVCRMVDKDAQLPKAEADQLKKMIMTLAEQENILAQVTQMKSRNPYRFELMLELARYSPEIGLNKQMACKRMYTRLRNAYAPVHWQPALKNTWLLLQSKAAQPAQAFTGACSVPAIANELRSLAHHHFEYDHSDPNFHKYCHATPLCRETPKGRCSVGNAYALLKRFPAPMLDGYEGADENSLSELTVGVVSHKLLPNDHALVNYTIEGEHMLHPGAVLRKIVRHKGFLYVGTYGEGTASYGDPFGFLACVNESHAEQIWGGVDRSIVAGLASMR